jgi:hypothetical protein
MVRAGRSTATGYRDAPHAARNILTEYFVLAQVPAGETRRYYSCEVTRFGFGDCLATPDSHATVNGKEIR